MDPTVQEYRGGVRIDFQNPAQHVDPGAMAGWSTLSFDRQLGEVEAVCKGHGVDATAADLRQLLAEFAKDPTQALQKAAQLLDAEATTVETQWLCVVRALCDRPATATTLQCLTPNQPLQLEGGATHFGIVLEGSVSLVRHGIVYTVPELHYFAAPGDVTLRGPGRAVIITHRGAETLFSIGGPVEEWGRLQYIDGCTDTLLIAPARLGDPCFNALYFPPNTQQTPHVHPSLRAGVVVSGQGECVTARRSMPLRPGQIFFLPPEAEHAFHTPAGPGRCALSVVAFHPDSDFGPTDDDHPMLNRTYVALLHRLRSAARTR